jgi:delta14-sterol reductase
MSTPSTKPQEEVTTTITATAEFTLPPKSELNPKSKPTEFFGPIGTAAVTIGTPFTAYALFYACNEVEGCSVSGAGSALSRVLTTFDFPSSAGKLFEWKALGVYCVWYAWCVLCWAVLPQDWIEGHLLRDGTRKKYKMNGECCHVVYCGSRGTEVRSLGLLLAQ